MFPLLLLLLLLLLLFQVWELTIPRSWAERRCILHALGIKGVAWPSS